MIEDMVNHPSHYKVADVPECIEYTRHMSFNGGNAFKYLYRLGTKEGHSDKEDVRKAMWYLYDQLTQCRERENSLWKRIKFKICGDGRNGAPTSDRGAITIKTSRNIREAMIYIIFAETSDLQGEMDSLRLALRNLGIWVQMNP